MIEKLQTTYDFYISLSNLNYNLSQELYMKELHRELLSKAEAFEAAADHLWSKFKNEIIPTTTKRFNEIREINLEEMNSDKTESHD